MSITADQAYKTWRWHLRRSRPIVNAGGDSPEAQWRREQVFEDVQLNLATSSRAQTWGASGAVLGVLTVAAVGVAVATNLPHPTANPVGGAQTPAATSAPTGQAPESLSPQAAEAAQVAIIEAVNADAVNFGGAFIDPNGTLVIQYYGDNAGAVAVEPLIVEGLAVRWDHVERTLAELTRIHDEIVAAWPNGVSSIGIDTAANQVVVALLQGASAADVAEALAQYGDAVRLDTSGQVIVPGLPTLMP